MSSNFPVGTAHSLSLSLSMSLSLNPVFVVPCTRAPLFVNVLMCSFYNPRFLLPKKNQAEQPRSKDSNRRRLQCWQCRANILQIIGCQHASDEELIEPRFLHRFRLSCSPIYPLGSPLLFLCSVVLSFDLDAYSPSGRSLSDEWDYTVL